MLTIDHQVEVTLALLRQAAREVGMSISGDERVGEADAAILLGYSAKYVGQLRGEGCARDRLEASLAAKLFMAPAMSP
jgi:fructose-specific component phosphotransferase system IIB-like protein